MPQQLGVGVKFESKLLVMGLKMVMHQHNAFIIISVNISIAY